MFTIFSTFANEVLEIKIAHTENNYDACLTDNGKTIAFLNGNKFAQTINLIDTNDWSVKSIYSPFLGLSEELKCGTNSIVVLGKDYIRKLDTNEAKQIAVKSKGYKSNLWGYRYLIGNTLFETNSTLARVTSLDAFKNSKDIKLGTTNYYDLKEYSEKYIYIRHMHSGSLDDNYTLMDISSGRTKDISSKLRKCTYVKLTTTGDYLHASCFNNSTQETRVFNTKTLLRNSALEDYLNKANHKGYNAKTVKFFEQYKHFLLIAFKETFIIWNLDSNKVENSYKSACFITKYSHQNGKVLISCGSETPYTLIDLDNQKISKQPFAYNKPLQLYIQNNIPKAILKTGDTSIGVWNILEHTWEQRFKSDPFFKRNVYSQDKIKPIISGINIFITRGYWEGKDPIRQYNLENGNLLFSYRADSSGNYPEDMSVSELHHKLIVHYRNVPKCDGFKIYDTLNGKLLYDVKAKQRHINVNSMKLSKDGNVLIVTTRASKGTVNMEEEGYYKYDNQPSIMTFDIKTKHVITKANLEKDTELTEVVKGDNFTISWNEKHKSVSLSKDDNPYRQFYLYMPYGTSEWIDIDNFGHFDSSKLGLNYLYICDELKCTNINQKAKNYFYNSHTLEKFILQSKKYRGQPIQ